ncbi:MAG: hypothetical protein WD509_03035 [Candidatus Paceibacterota bacterium]
MKGDTSEEKDLLPRDQIFTRPFEQRFLSWYRRVFSINEVEESLVLKFFFGAMLFVFFLGFSSWMGSRAITLEAFKSGSYTCWPYFQSCGEWYFLSVIPYGYSQTILYMAFFGAMLLIVSLMWKRDWVLAHMLMMILFVWEVLLLLVLTGGLSGNYDYYHIFLTFVLLFVPYKMFFLKLVFVLFYFLSATVKIDDGWILGSYFTALQTGLPIFPDSVAPLVTNMVIFMQVIGAWFLMSKNKVYQRVALFYFIVFHLYSGILVQYRYPATVLPALLILFGPLYQYTKVPLVKKTLAGWLLVILLCIFQSIPLLISGDHKTTLEGNKYGFYMFEANHQCISDVAIYNKDGSVATSTSESILARNRCNPYDRWFQMNQLCQRAEDVEKIAWTFDHSINGDPFYRIVDEENVCNLEYKAFSHNEWIKTPEEGAEVIGYPVKNIYR